MPKREARTQRSRNVDKSVEKSPVPKQLKPFVPGPDKRRGNGPKKGAPNAGRPPNAWKARMEALRDRWLIATEASSVVDDTEHPLFVPLGKFLHEAVAGKPAQSVAVQATAEVTVRFVSEAKP